ncbi:hypothetical protein DFQ29_007089 [Apophysomyces sp. BC1021]|nr:hypothetical protein DFQ29_007089 [Apophysomyces sp. BC1021]
MTIKPDQPFANTNQRQGIHYLIGPVRYFTWLVFLNEKWVPFDLPNQTKLEQTLGIEGTFVDINDSHFPGVKRVRVFPRSNYLSYLGLKYRLSRIMQPDAWLDTMDTKASHTVSNECSSEIANCS